MNALFQKSFQIRLNSMNKDAFHILSDIYPEDINFLDEKDDFRFLSSVLLSAQTTDKRVNEVTPILFA